MRDIIFLSYRGAPPRAPQCQVVCEEWRNSIKRGTTGGLLPSLFAESRHLQTLGLDHRWKLKGSNASQRESEIEIVSMSNSSLPQLVVFRMDRSQRKLVIKVNGQCDIELFC